MTKEEFDELQWEQLQHYWLMNPVPEIRKKQKEVAISGVKAMAEYIRTMARRGDRVALMGPPLIYEKNGVDHVMAITITGPKQVDSIDFGRHVPEIDRDSPLYQMAHCVFELRTLGDTTISEAREKMAELVEETCKLFEHVETFACDKELVRAYVKYWPCDHSRNLAKEMLP